MTGQYHLFFERERQSFDRDSELVTRILALACLLFPRELGEVLVIFIFEFGH